MWTSKNVFYREKQNHHRNIFSKYLSNHLFNNNKYFSEGHSISVKNSFRVLNPTAQFQKPNPRVLLSPTREDQNFEHFQNSRLINSKLNNPQFSPPSPEFPVPQPVGDGANFIHRYEFPLIGSCVLFQFFSIFFFVPVDLTLK